MELKHKPCCAEANVDNYFLEKSPALNLDTNLARCPTCYNCIGLTLSSQKFITLEESLKIPQNCININSTRDSSSKYIWKKVQNTDERQVLFLLIQIFYNENEADFKNEISDDGNKNDEDGGQYSDEVKFSLPEATEFTKLLWVDGNAAGFYSLKLKNSLDFGTMQTYQMTTLDIIFIRRPYRRQGYCSSAILDILKEFNGEKYIGISNPISYPMLMTLKSHLEKNVEDRLKFWELNKNYFGNRSCIWFNLFKKS